MATADSPDSCPVSDSRQSWSPAAKVFASVLIGFHLFAVFSAPWGSPPPSSALAQSVRLKLHPYTQSLAIDNGYRFFAPNPEPSQIVRYTLKYSDGTTTQGQFPHRDTQRPRLYYHRHLILADTIARWVAAAPDLPPGLLLGPEERKEYDRLRNRSTMLLRAVADHLLHVHPTAESVEMVLHEHEIPTPSDILNGVKLTDDALYASQLKLGVFPREQP